MFSDFRRVVLSVFTLVAFAAFLILPPIPQSLAYHDFIDCRCLFGINHFWNIVTNIPIAAIGILGLYGLVHKNVHLPKGICFYWLWVFISIVCVGFGSAYYHQNPNNYTLFWGRLPLALSLVSILSYFLHERVSARLARTLHFPLIALAVSSALYWIYSESIGAGDLRAYGLIQFGTFILLVAIISMFRQGRDDIWIALGLGSYMIAKFFEHFDEETYELLGNTISGHSLKHIWVAIGLFFVYRYFSNLLGRKAFHKFKVQKIVVN